MLRAIDGYIRILLGVVLAGAIGAFIAEEYRTRAAQYQEAADIMREHTELLNSRVFLMNQVFYALEQEDLQDGLEDRWDEYRVFLRKYNAERGANRIMMELYYGQKLANQERNFHYQMRYVGQRLECYYRGDETVLLADLESELDELWRGLGTLTRRMGTALRDKHVGNQRPLDSVEKSRDLPNHQC